MYPYTLLRFAMATFAVCATALPALAEENCSTCDAVRFPEAVAFLESQGLPPSDYNLLLAWTESAPQAPRGFAAGYRLKPTAGGEPFDLYADANGTLLGEAQAAEKWGVSQKDWTLKPASVEAEPDFIPVEDKASQASPAPKYSAQPAEVVLPPVDLVAVLREDQSALNTLPKTVHRIGVLQPLSEPLRVKGSSATKGSWQVQADGTRVWAVTLVAADAKGQRVHFQQLTLPYGGEAIVYNADNPAEVFGPFTGPFPGETDLWSPTCFSERVGVEIRVPAAADLQETDVQIDRIGYQYVDFGELPWNKVGGCHNDVTCFPEWAETAKGVAGIGSIDVGSGILWCTGTLLADSDPGTSVPLFLTANHCVDRQAAASSLEIYWLYQTSTCNGNPPNPATVPRTTGGADFLAGSSVSTGTDFALLRLRNNPPSSVTFVGWSSAAATNESDAICIHHPDGDFKRISFGTIDQTVPPLFDQSATRFYGVYWNSGVTEPGSSGSPLFNSAQQVIGQLWGGTSACVDGEGDPDTYGRFNQTYPVIASYLGGNIRVTRPNGGEIWELGDTQTIQWFIGTGTGAAVRIELLRGSAVTLTLANSEPNDGNFSWTIPSDLPEAADYRIRITSTSTASFTDTSDQPFTLVVQPEVRVLSPNGGETWPVGSQKEIRWSALGVEADAVRIELRKDSIPVTTIVQSTQNDGSYLWVLPNTLAIGGGYTVFIATTTGTVISDESDSTFSLSNEKSVTITEPNGGETFQAGLSGEITWASNGLFGVPVDIYLVRVTAPNTPIATIADDTANDGSFEWNVPADSPTGTNFLIRIVATGGSQAADVSNAVFSISQCAPGAPGSVTASDGAFADRVRVQWSEAEGATQYRIYRSTVDDVTKAAPLSWWIETTAYDDYTAEVQGATAGTGCTPGGGGTGTLYYYWVRTRNDCAESGFSANDSGYRGTSFLSAKQASLVPVPFSRQTVGDTLLFAAVAGALIATGRFRARKRRL